MQKSYPTQKQNTRGCHHGLTLVRSIMDRMTPIDVVTPEGRFRPMWEIEDEMVRRAMLAADDNASEAARLLGIGRSTLYRWFRRVEA